MLSTGWSDWGGRCDIRISIALCGIAGSEGDWPHFPKCENPWNAESAVWLSGAFSSAVWSLVTEFVHELRRNDDEVNSQQRC
jgi:hypothetical protein